MFASRKSLLFVCLFLGWLWDVWESEKKEDEFLILSRKRQTLQ